MAQCSDAILKSTFINHGLFAHTHAHTHELLCVCVYLGGPMCAPEKGKIESAAALPYHQFTVLHFPYACMSCCMSSLYTRRCCFGQCIISSTAVPLRQILYILSPQQIRVKLIQISLCVAFML